MRANLPIGSTSPTSQRNGNWFARLAVATSRISGRPTTFLLAVAVVLIWAITGPPVRLQRYLATRRQHWHDDRDVSDGLSDPGDAEPRHAGAAIEAGRADYGDQKREEPHRRHRGCFGRRDRKGEDRYAATRLMSFGGPAAAAARPPSAAPRWHLLRTPPSGGKAAGHRSGCWAHPFDAIGRFRAANFSTLKEAT